jgi:hypothetical protein
MPRHATEGRRLPAATRSRPRPPDLPDLPGTPDRTARLDGSQHAGRAFPLRRLPRERQAGAPRRYFGNRAHALYVLRSIAPTKLVDGAWLQGLLRTGATRGWALVRTYVEELGEGAVDKNHVVLYRGCWRAMRSIRSTTWTTPVPPGRGAARAGLERRGLFARDRGFNLGYEQLPLHLLITAYELNELGLDPYYFTLHVTVDNADTGHARRAVPGGAGGCCRARTTAARSGAACRRQQAGLGAGLGTGGGHRRLRRRREVLRILRRKAAGQRRAFGLLPRGRAATSTTGCHARDLPAFLAALEQAGWIRRGEPAANSRFWKLLQGERAEMFGVFSSYELQVIHDWIRGDASADGQAYAESAPTGARRASFRAAARLAAQRQARDTGVADDDLLDTDTQQLKQRLAAAPDPQAAARLLVEAMSPSAHWTPAGLYATRLFQQTFA